MQRLEANWAAQFPSGSEWPAGGIAAACVGRLAFARPIDSAKSTQCSASDARWQVRMRTDLLDEGWIPDTAESFELLEGAHIQVYYFQVRWFPRLRWFTLRPPYGQFFVRGDRPVGWGVPERLDAPPRCLRDEAAFLVAPLSRSLALVGRNSFNSLESDAFPSQRAACLLGTRSDRRSRLPMSLPMHFAIVGTLQSATL